MKKRLHNLKLDVVQGIVSSAQRSLDRQRKLKRQSYKLQRRGGKNTLLNSSYQLSIAVEGFKFNLKKTVLKLMIR